MALALPVTNHFGFSLPSKCTKSSFLSRSIRILKVSFKWSNAPNGHARVFRLGNTKKNVMIKFPHFYTLLMIFPFRSLMHKLFSQAPLTLYPKQERAWKYLSWTSQPSWNIEEHCLLHPKSCKTVLEQDKLTTVWASDAWAAVPSLTLHRLPRGKPFQLAWNEVVKCRERDWSSVLSIHVWSFLKFLYAEVNALVETYKLNALRWSGFDSVDSVWTQISKLGWPNSLHILHLTPSQEATAPMAIWNSKSLAAQKVQQTNNCHFKHL